METQTFERSHKPFVPWNKGKVTGQKPPLKPREVWAIRVRLQISNRVRDLALFNLAIDSKLRGCDLVHLRVEDVMQADQVRTRALVSQRKTGAPVQFEITEQARAAIATWVRGKDLKGSDWLFPSRVDRTQSMTTFAEGLSGVRGFTVLYDWHFHIDETPGFYEGRSAIIGGSFSRGDRTTTGQNRFISGSYIVTPTRIYFITRTEAAAGYGGREVRRW